jgi:hypothetical protein
MGSCVSDGRYWLLKEDGLAFINDSQASDTVVCLAFDVRKRKMHSFLSQNQKPKQQQQQQQQQQ